MITNDCILMLDHKTIKEQKLYNDLFEDTEISFKKDFEQKEKDVTLKPKKRFKDMLYGAEKEPNQDIIEFEKKLNRNLEKYVEESQRQGQDKEAGSRVFSQEQCGITSKFIQHQSKFFQNQNKIMETFLKNQGDSMQKQRFEKTRNKPSKGKKRVNRSREQEQNSRRQGTQSETGGNDQFSQRGSDEQSPETRRENRGQTRKRKSDYQNRNEGSGQSRRAKNAAIDLQTRENGRGSRPKAKSARERRRETETRADSGD